ncbi:MAG TPA: CHASE3 domain-containing protein [Sphingomonas sp.]|uniref:sensor histidine kinase n=1 Tax=Sphingomonas sp. TaxID=28214 RepID=UPI002CBE333A|nr:CHASE3 domain-containing protein [Sphingomonas sp.]HMI20370.1 CHASE3 domain-containing protein [Sphingomonas sp.]
MAFSIKNVTVTDRWFNRLVVGAVALGFIALLAAGISAFQSIQETQAHSRWVQHTYAVEQELSHFNAVIERAETGRRGYLLSGAPNTLQTYLEARNDLLPTLARMRALTSDNLLQQHNIARLKLLVRRDIAIMDQSVALAGTGHRDAAIAQFRATVALQLMRSIRTIATAMGAEENRLLVIRDEAQASSLHIFYITVTVAGIILVLVGGGSMWLISRYTRDLANSRDALRLLNEDLEGAVRERTMDLQRANDEIQRFAYIVSHDLRAPLVNVMGFTSELESATQRLGAMMDRVEERAPDLIDKDARIAAREDLPEAIGFIRTSTNKMDRLINAILRLSREGRRPIAPERLDMSALFQNVADTQRHRIDELNIDFTVAPNLPGITSDRLAVEQIVSNLIENAVKYMVPGRKGRIEIRGRAEGQRAIFEIADNGRGIDPKDHERVFDLFRRSGQQDQPGEGIGLAHTRALAYRLGGMISVESELGRGATFRINLPVAFVGEQGNPS